MSLFSRLFGGSGAATQDEPETHNGFRIYPEPVKDGGSYRVAARIEKELGGEMKSHGMLRADTYNSLDAASEASLHKARALIDQQGDAIFD